jgi:hypothetical protein
VTHDHDPADLQVRLAAAITDVLEDGQPPVAIIEELGGWSGVEALAPSLIDDPLLAPLAALVCGYVEVHGIDEDAATSAALALAEAAVACADPYLFGQTLDHLCSNPDLVALIGTPLAEALWPLARPPVADPDAGLAVTQRSADALETYLRLTLAEHGSKNRLFTLFEDVKQPIARRYAQAVIRAVVAAHDRWDLDDNLVETIDVLSGAVPPRGCATVAAAAAPWSQAQTEGVVTDAAWAKANIELLRGLRAPDAAQTLSHLEEARRALVPAVADEAAIDAGILDSVLNVLIQFVQGAAANADAWAVDAESVAELQRRLQHFEIGAFGLQHWATERKSRLLVAWTRLTQDIEFLSDKLQQPSLYDAAVILDDVVEIYIASGSGDVVTQPGDLGGVRRIVQPSIVRSFATRAGLLRNLEDHVRALQIRVDDINHPSHDRAVAHLPVAESVLASARNEMARETSSGKKDDGAVAATLPPLLDELITSVETRAALTEMDADVLAQLSQDLEDRRIINQIVPHVVITNVTRTIRAALAECSDYEDQVKAEVDHLLDLLVRFLHVRMNIESRYKPYLYKPDASERDLHLDLFDWLAGQDIAGYAGIEVTNVAGGRADIQISYGPFHLYLELKADDTQVPLADKAAYIQQTVAYQGADVQISFLVVLRLAKDNETNAPPHLSTLVSHTTVTVGEGTDPRHVVMVEVPGNRSKPSEMR